MITVVLAAFRARKTGVKSYSPLFPSRLQLPDEETARTNDCGRREESPATPRFRTGRDVAGDHGSGADAAQFSRNTNADGWVQAGAEAPDEGVQPGRETSVGGFRPGENLCG